MAIFFKAQGQDVQGWDKTSHTQSIQEGKETMISLGGYDLGSFFIVSSDPAICTVHERTPANTPRPIMQRDFLLTAVKDGECELRAMYSDTSKTVLASVKIVVKNQKMAAKLVFFPGERRVGDCTMGTIFVVGGNGERYDAAGGSPQWYKDNGGHRSDPTPKGTYVLGAQHKATTGTWPNSSIPFGAALRLGTEVDRVEYLVGGNTWAAVNGPKGIVIRYMKEFAKKDGKTRTTEDCDEELSRVLFLEGDKKLPPGQRKTLRINYWDQNDFGRWAWNLTQNNRATEFFVHTTPLNEIQTINGWAVTMTNSHGCIHITPKTRDRMIADGYLKKGTILEVKSYDDVSPMYVVEKK